MIDKVKAKIIELCPDVMETRDCECPAHIVVKHPVHDSRIGIAVVLRAVEKVDRGQDFGEVEYSTFGDIFHIGKYEKRGRNGYYSKAFWDLKFDYDHQTKETQLFVGSLLGVV